MSEGRGSLPTQCDSQRCQPVQMSSSLLWRQGLATPFPGPVTPPTLQHTHITALCSFMLDTNGSSTGHKMIYQLRRLFRIQWHKRLMHIVNQKEFGRKGHFCFKTKGRGIELQRIWVLKASAYFKEMFWCLAGGLRKTIFELLKLTFSTWYDSSSWERVLRS